MTPYATPIVEGRGVDESVHSNSSVLVVLQPPAMAQHCPPLASAGPSNSSSPTGFYTNFRSVMPTKRERAMPTATFTFSILKANMQRMGRKVELYENDQAFIQLTEATANASHAIHAPYTVRCS